jgi:glycine dehydrogenase subunit 2
VRLKQAGFELAFPQRRASHEFILTIKQFADKYHVNAMDFAKRLLDKGFHAPTTYFPNLVAECLLIEPTETEDKQTLDNFIAALQEIGQEAQTQPELVRNAPHNLPIQRLDEIKAVKDLDVVLEN